MTIVSTLLASLQPRRASAQPADPSTAPAGQSAPTAAAPRQAVRFHQQATRPGDQVTQRMSVNLGLTTRITQSGQIAHESQSTLRRQQDRVIEVLEASDGSATRAQATFQISRRQSPDSARPDQFASQPIEGKTYLMTRQEDKLQITDLTGATPPEEELRLAAESLENVGKPNPLASLLAARQVAIGERILVPRELVQQLLGFDDPIGAVRRFELTLLRVEPPGAVPAPLAVFGAAIAVVPNNDSPLSIELAGEIGVETDSCRLAFVTLTGPVQLSSIERTAGGIYQYSAGGELELGIRSEYGRTEVASRRP